MKKKVFDFLREKLKVKSLTHLKDRYKRKIDKIFYQKLITSEDLEGVFRNMGIEDGDVVFIHSSWNEFYNYQGSPETFIDLLLGLIGEQGTLLMPSYPLLKNKNGVFSIKTTPTAAGLLPEIFRKYKRIERSLDYHSVAAFGRLARYMTESHIHSETSWDENSPYYKLAEVKAKVFSIGLGKHHVGTIMHCADSILRKENKYFGQFFKKNADIKIRKEDGEIITKKYLTKEDDFYFRFTDKSHWGIVKNYFQPNKYKTHKISNLTITMFDACYAVHRAIELGRKGIVVYTDPDPKKFIW
jgi:aminoglycoside 3-N-acetyltransferase